MTPYKLLRQACGLSQREAAEFRGVRLDTVKSWDTGRNNAPQDAVDQLKDLYGLLVEAAGNAVETIQLKTADEIEIAYPLSDADAQSKGLPCLGAWEAMTAMVIAELEQPVKLVPRQ